MSAASTPIPGRGLGTFKLPDGSPYAVAAGGVGDRRRRRALTATTGDEFYGTPGIAPFGVIVDDGAVTWLEQIYRP